MEEKKLVGPFTPDHREGQTRTMSDYIQERASSIPAGKQIKKEDGETKRKSDGERKIEDVEIKIEDGEGKRGERKKGDGERKGEDKREEEREGERKGEDKREEEREGEIKGEEKRGEEGEREGEEKREEGEAEEEREGGNGKMRITVLATVAVLVISSPFLLIFSPILIPAGLILGSVMAGFLVVAGIALAGAHMAAWFYHVITDMKERGGQSEEEEVERERDQERERVEEEEKEKGEMEKEKEKKKKEELKEKENKEKEKEMKEKEEEDERSSSSGSLLISIMSLIKATRTSLATAGPFLWMMRITLLSTIGALVIASPFLLIFSPILIPAALIIGATIASFAVAASMALAGLHMLAWSYHVIRDIKRKNIGEDYIKE